MTEQNKFTLKKEPDEVKEEGDMIQVMQKRISDKDDFIGTLKEENQRYREMISDLEKSKQDNSTVRETLESLAKQKEKTEQPSSSGTELNEDTIVEKTMSLLQEKEKEKQEVINFNRVKEELEKTYSSDKVDEKVEEVIKSSGLSFEDIVSLSKKSPTAALALFKENTKSFTSPIHGTKTSINTDGSVRDRAWFSDLRRKNPKLYWSPDIQKEFRSLFD